MRATSCNVTNSSAVGQVNWLGNRHVILGEAHHDRSTYFQTLIFPLYSFLFFFLLCQENLGQFSRTSINFIRGGCQPLAIRNFAYART